MSETGRKVLFVLFALFVAETAVAQTGPKSLPAIKSQADFDKISVTYDANTPYALPHVMIVIDRQNGNKIYYINKKRYSFHKDFVNGTYLSLERGREFFVNNYINPIVASSSAPSLTKSRSNPGPSSSGKAISFPPIRSSLLTK